MEFLSGWLAWTHLLHQATRVGVGSLVRIRLFPWLPSRYHRLQFLQQTVAQRRALLEGVVSGPGSPLSSPPALHPCAQGEPLPALLLVPPSSRSCSLLRTGLKWGRGPLTRPAQVQAGSLHPGLSQGSYTTLRGGRPLSALFCEGLGKSFLLLPTGSKPLLTSAQALGLRRLHAVCLGTDCSCFLLGVSLVVGRNGVRGLMPLP